MNDKRYLGISIHTQNRNLRGRFRDLAGRPSREVLTEGRGGISIHIPPRRWNRRNDRYLDPCLRLAPHGKATVVASVIDEKA